MANSFALRKRIEMKRQIREHWRWDDYRQEHGVSLADTKELPRFFRDLFGHDFTDDMVPADSDDSATTDTTDSTDKVETVQRDDSSSDDSDDSEVKEALETLQAALAKRGGIDEARVIELIKAHGTVRHVVEMRSGDETTYRTGDDEFVHPKFADLLRVMGCRTTNGATINVWLSGPTGSGKTHAASQAAKALGLPFYFNGALDMTHELLGYVSPVSGEYQMTPFRQAFEHGGVYLADEIDAWNNGPLLAINAALANGQCAFPDQPEPVKRHADFRMIGAGNTWGSGATAEFIGRAKIDAAVLSRFPVKLAWNYDAELEQSLSGDAAFAKRVQRARIKAAEAGMKVVIDPRHSMAGAALIAAGMSADEAARMTYLAGLSEDQIRILENS